MSEKEEALRYGNTPNDLHYASFPRDKAERKPSPMRGRFFFNEQ
jgi:hypothetical protein